MCFQLDVFITKLLSSPVVVIDFTKHIPVAATWLFYNMGIFSLH